MPKINVQQPPPTNTLNYFHIVVVGFGFSEGDFWREEGPNAAVQVRIIKDRKIRLANSVIIRVTPQTVDTALRNGVIASFRDEDNLSPNRASKYTDFDHATHRQNGYSTGSLVCIFKQPAFYLHKWTLPF